MARRRSSAAEDLVEVASRFPWWAGVVAALAAFIALRVVASIEVPLTPDSKQIGSLVIRQAIRPVVMFGQWVLPALLLVGAAVSYFKQRKGAALHDEVAKRGKLAPFAAISWQDFERVVGEYFRRRGFEVAETGGGGANGGVDIALTRGSDRYLVQCKHWRALRVGVEPVRELYGVIHARRAAAGFNRRIRDRVARLSRRQSPNAVAQSRSRCERWAVVLGLLALSDVPRDAAGMIRREVRGVDREL